MVPSFPSSFQPQRLSSDAELVPSERLFRFYQTTLAGPFPLHWHEFYEVSFILSGTGTNAINGVDQPLAPGSIFFLTPVDFHTIRPLDSPLRIYNLIFTEEMLSNEIRDLLLTGAGEHAITSQLTGTQFAEVQALYEEINQEAKTMLPGHTILVHGAIERILILISRHAASGNPRSCNLVNQHPGIRKALFYLHHHFRESLNLSETAAIANLAPHYFSELFHAQVGQTFQEYLQHLRISFAGKLLRSTPLPVTEICFQAGIGSIAQFDRVFKRQFGCSPRDYRQSHPQEPTR